MISMGIAPSSVELRIFGVLGFIKLWRPDDCSTMKTSETVDRESEWLILIFLRKIRNVVDSYWFLKYALSKWPKIVKGRSVILYQAGIPLGFLRRRVELIKSSVYQCEFKTTGSIQLKELKTRKEEILSFVPQCALERWSWGFCWQTSL